MQNMADILTAEFECLKISAMRKALRVSDYSMKSPEVTYRNGQNTRISEPNVVRATNGKLSTRTDITFSIKKIRLENELQRKQEVKVCIQVYIWS